MRYTQSQSGPVRLDWSNPLTRGALSIIDPVSRKNLVSGQALRGSSASTQTIVTKAGQALDFNGSWLETETLPAIGTAPFVEFWYGYPSANFIGSGTTTSYADFITGSDKNLIGIYQKRSYDNFWGVTRGWDTGTQVVSAGVTLPYGTLCVLVALYKPGGVEFYVNGLYVGTTTTVTYNQPAATQIIGAFIEDTPNWASQSRAVLAGRILADWSPANVASFSANPWQIFAAPNGIKLLKAAASGATQALTGNGATGQVGSLGISVAASRALTGTSATGQVGTVGLTVAATRALTGNAATGQVGTVSPSISTNLALTGNASTGQVGAVGVSVDATRALTGVAGTGAVGSVSVAVAVAISGNVATGAVGTVTPNTGTVVALTGTAAIGAAGTVGGSVAVSTALSGVSGSGQIGSVAATSGSALALTGIAATGAVGNVTASATATAAITGVSAAGAVGDVVVGGNKTVALSGVLAAGGVGNVSILSGLGGAEWKKQRRNKFYREEHEFQVRQEAAEAVEAARTRVIAPVKQVAQVIAEPAFDDEDEEELMLLL